MKLSRVVLAAAAAAALTVSPLAQAVEHALSADVVVVGAGAAGMAASVKAAELGAKVILLEKNAFIGGGASFAEGLYGIETEWQRSKNYGLSEADTARYIQRFDHFLADSHLNRTFLKESAQSLEWLAKHGLKFEAIQVSPAETMTWHVIGQYGKLNHGAAYIQALKDHADRLGVKTMMQTPGKSLVMKNGRVAGITAADAKGDTYRIATTQVILATGGFGDNGKLIGELLHRNPQWVKPSVPLNKTGDGIQMAWKAGADRTSATAVMHPGTEGKGIKFLGNIYVMSWQPSNMWVNSRGERFAPETLPFEFSLAGNAIASQYKASGWAIFDDAAIEYSNTKGVDVGIGVIIPTKTKLGNLSKELEDAVKAGSESVKKAGSITELARQIGVPEKTLAQTYADYNRYARFGYDPDFFKEHMWMRPIDKGTLYAVRLRPYFFCTIGGVRVDRGLHVLDRDDRVIPGLYATGADAGGTHGDTYTTWLSGHLFGFAAWSGQKAAENAVKALGKK